MSLTETQICERLSVNRTQIYHYPNSPHLDSRGLASPAAVLVPLVLINRHWHLLYIRRAENSNDKHSGQVAFPGGRHEEDDPDLKTTALREAWEELGLVPEKVRVLGRLGDHFSVTNFQITPIVGKIPWPYPLRIDATEVSRWFTIPLRWLADPCNREIRQQQFGHQQCVLPVIYFHDYEGETLWGATARITVELLDRLDEHVR